MLNTIRAKLVFWYLVLLGGVLSFFSLFLYLTMEKRLKENLDAKLRSTAYLVAQALSEPLMPGPSLLDLEKMIRERLGVRPMGRYLQILDQSGKKATNLEDLEIPISFEALEKASKGQEAFEELKLRDGTAIRLITVPVNVKGKLVGIVQVGSPLDEVKEALRQLSLVLLITVPLVLVLASMGGVFLANKALRPVDHITKTAQRIGSGDLSQRIPVDGLGEDEIGRLARTFNEMLSRLERSFEQIKRFTADASHELKTPLSILRGELEVALKRQRKAEEYREVLVSCLEEVERMSKIVEDLLTLARADSGNFKLRLETVDLYALAREVFEFFKNRAEEKGIRFTLEGGSVQLRGDKERLRQLVVNLVDNAIKYTPREGEVELKAFEEDGQAVLIVRDTGEGIPPEEQQKVFERFYRVDKSRSREKGGAGLGLAICKWIAEVHGGVVTLKSEPLKGSEFTVRLPLGLEGRPLES